MQGSTLFNQIRMDLEIELAALLFLCAWSTSIFDKFEVETAAWRKLLRWMLAAVLTPGTAPFIGHWALAVLLSLRRRFGYA
jgi:hypothetical protein